MTAGDFPIAGTQAAADLAFIRQLMERNGRVWRAPGIAMTLVFLGGGPLGTLPWKVAPGLAAAFIGGAVTLQGTLAGSGWLRKLAAGWWSAATVMLACPGLHARIVYTIAILLLHLVPGFVLHAGRSRLLDKATRHPALTPGRDWR